ncbi:MAG TPA: pseudouridine synthase [Herpetosiphonaceae bacterium]
MLERLHKVLARAGVAALRPAEDMIMAGRVTVNGRVVRELGARVDPESDVIAVDGELIEIRKPSDPHRYVLVHKPVDVISTAHDTHDRPTVVGLVPTDQRLFPVGRLDADSEGLILLTDDGDLAYRLTHPRFEVEKEYRVLLDRTPTIEDLRTWREGVELEGEMTMPAWVEVLERDAAGSWIRVVMREGRKRQIREIARILGYEVLRLIRVREGPIGLGDIAPGEWRDLTPAEVQLLRAHTQHIPSRAADEEAERRMAERNRPDGRRLRVIRGLRRPEGSETAPMTDRPSGEAEESRESFEERQTVSYDPPSFSHADQQRAPQDTDDAAPGDRPRTDERRPYSNQRQAPRDFNRSGDSARRSPRSQDDRGGGYRERSDRPYNSGGPRRDTGSRGRDFGDRSERSGNQRDFGNRGPGDNRGFGNRGPSDNRGFGNRGPSDNRRSFGDRSGNQRDFGNRGPGDNRGFGDRSERSGNQRDFGNRGPGDNRGGFGNRGPGDNRGGFGNRGPSDNRRSFGDRSERSGEQRDFGNRRPGPGQGGRSYGGQRSTGRGGNYGDPSDYRERRDYQQGGDDPRSGNRSPRDYNEQRSRPSGPGGPRRSFGESSRDRYGRGDDERGARGDDERRSGSFGQRGPSRGPGGFGNRSGGPRSGPANRSGGPRSGGGFGGASRGGSGGGGFGGASRSGGPSRTGGRPGARPNRPGSSGGSYRPGGNRTQRPPSRGPRKDRNND